MFYHVDLSLDGLNIVTWVLSAIAVPLSIGRFWIRWRVRGRFFVDDYCHLAALLLLLASSAIQSASFVPYRVIINVPHGKPPPQDAFVEFRKIKSALVVTNYACKWAVKFSYLYFYRLLFWISPIFRKLWWSVFGLLVITFWFPIAAWLHSCGDVSDLYNAKVCAQDTYIQNDELITIGVLGAVTDLCVMALPLYILPRLQMQRGRKLGLAFLFSMGFFDVALGIVSTVASTGDGIFSDSSLYATLEYCVAVYLSSLPTYRALFGLERSKVTGPKYENFVFSRRQVQQNTYDASGKNVSARGIMVRTDIATESESNGRSVTGGFTRLDDSSPTTVTATAAAPPRRNEYDIQLADLNAPAKVHVDPGRVV